MKTHYLAALLFVIILGVAFSPAISQSAQGKEPAPPATAPPALPDGPGKAELTTVCNGCHDVNVVTQMRQSKDDWSQTIDQMLGQGAQATDEQVSLILNYLAEHFGTPIYINQASMEMLRDSLGLTPEQADALVKYREQNGDFKDLAALLKVPDIDRTKIQEQSDNIFFQAPENPK